MLDWTSRIDDLADKLAREYAMDDRPVLEVLLAALVECPRTSSCWLILETNWFGRQCQDAWFALGKQWVPCSLPRLRVRSPWREIEREIQGMLDEPAGDIKRLFVECDFERYPRFHRLTQAQYILQRSLRIRTRAARSADPLHSLDQREQERRTDELSAAARYALEDHASLRPVDPPRFVEPPKFLYHVELLQRLAPWYPDWQTLVKAFASIAVRRAYLHGRTETDETDSLAMARVLRDSIPPWIAKALTVLLEGPAKTQTLEKHMQLEEKSRRSGHGAHRELVRLHRNGIIHWNKQAQSWDIVATHRESARTALESKTFQ